MTRGSGTWEHDSEITRRTRLIPTKIYHRTSLVGLGVIVDHAATRTDCGGAKIQVCKIADSRGAASGRRD